MCFGLRRAPERQLAQVLEYARRDPRFLAAFDEAAAAYMTGRQMAGAAVARLAQHGWRWVLIYAVCAFLLTEAVRALCVLA